MIFMITSKRLFCSQNGSSFLPWVQAQSILSNGSLFTRCKSNTTLGHKITYNNTQEHHVALSQCLTDICDVRPALCERLAFSFSILLSYALLPHVSNVQWPCTQSIINGVGLHSMYIVPYKESEKVTVKMVMTRRYQSVNKYNMWDVTPPCDISVSRNLLCKLVTCTEQKWWLRIRANFREFSLLLITPSYLLSEVLFIFPKKTIPTWQKCHKYYLPTTHPVI